MLKYLFVLLAVIVPLHADIWGDDQFTQERMIVDRNLIYVVSSLRDNDELKCYDFYGNQLWNTVFSTKVISWNLQPYHIVVLSKDRGFGNKNYVNCLDRATGACLWERS